MVPLEQGVPHAFGGYEVTYGGLKDVGENAEMNLSVTHGDVTINVKPLLRPSPDGMIRNPAILKSLTHDLCLEPGEIKEGRDAGEVLLDLDKAQEVGDLRLK